MQSMPGVWTRQLKADGRARRSAHFEHRTDAQILGEEGFHHDGSVDQASDHEL